MIKKLTPVLLCLPVFFFYANNVFAIADTFYTPTADTAKTNAHRITNKNFNAIYQQNLRVSFAGQEFGDKQRTLLVADLAPAFILLNTPKLPFFFVATARVNLRLLADQGSPVKSPSYMPGGTLYFRTNKDFYRPDFFSLGYSHHSNGIRGPTLNPDGTINTDSGKFTTNFYTLAYHTGKRTDKDDRIINRYDAIGLELHSALFGKGYSHDLKGKYGFVRVNGEWFYNIVRATPDPVDQNKKRLQNWQRLQFNFTYIADKYNDYNAADLKKRLNISLKYYYQFPFMENVALVAGGGYRGQDDYNIFFQDSYPYLTIGLAAGLSFNVPREK